MSRVTNFLSEFWVVAAVYGEVFVMYKTAFSLDATATFFKHHHKMLACQRKSAAVNAPVVQGQNVVAPPNFTEQNIIVVMRELRREVSEPVAPRRLYNLCRLCILASAENFIINIATTPAAKIFFIKPPPRRL